MVQLRGIRSLTQLIDSTIEEDLKQKGLDLILKLTASPRASPLCPALPAPLTCVQTTPRR